MWDHSGAQMASRQSTHGPLSSVKAQNWNLKLTTCEFSHRNRTLMRVLLLAPDSLQWPGSVSLPDKLLSPPPKTSTKWRMLTVSVIRHWRSLHLYLPTFTSFLEDYFNSLLNKLAMRQEQITNWGSQFSKAELPISIIGVKVQVMK